MRTLIRAIPAAVLVMSLAGQTPPAQQAKQGPSGAYQAAARLPARIVDFKATPSSIQPGQGTMLIWSTENPSSVTIDPDLGSVTARGSRQVKPSGTTTYTLTVNGPNGEQKRSKRSGS